VVVSWWLVLLVILVRVVLLVSVIIICGLSVLMSVVELLIECMMMLYGSRRLIDGLVWSVVWVSGGWYVLRIVWGGMLMFSLVFRVVVRLILVRILNFCVVRVLWVVVSVLVKGCLMVVFSV